MNAGLKIALFDEPEEEKTFIDESDKEAAMQVDVLPDYSQRRTRKNEFGKDRERIVNFGQRNTYELRLIV